MSIPILAQPFDAASAAAGFRVRYGFRGVAMVPPETAAPTYVVVSLECQHLMPVVQAAFGDDPTVMVLLDRRRPADPGDRSPDAPSVGEERRRQIVPFLDVLLPVLRT